MTEAEKEARGVPGFAEREKRATRAWEFFANDDRAMSHDFRGGYHQGLIDGWAPASGRGYADAIADLRWLADARDQYGSENVKDGVMTARVLAEILAETTPVNDGGTGWGWLPSWLWDEWDARRSRRRAPQPTDDDREALVNLIPLGFMERDPVRSVYEAADRILAAGFRRGAPAVTEQDEWEYALAHRNASWDEGDVEQVDDLIHARIFMAGWDDEQRADGVLVRRRKAGPWEPVTPKEDDR